MAQMTAATYRRQARAIVKRQLRYCGLDASHRCTAIYIKRGIDTGEKVRGKTYYNSAVMKLTAQFSTRRQGTFWIALDPQLIEQRGESMAAIIGHEIAHVLTSECFSAIEDGKEQLAASWEESICDVIGKLLGDGHV